MSGWIGILIGLGFAYYGIRRRFYDMWAILFNLAVSIYIGIFLWPTIIESFPVLGKTSLSAALTLLVTAAVLFAILQSLASLLLIGQFTVIFPKVIDTAGAAGLGILVGMLLWSFISLVITLTPLYQVDFVKELGFTDYSENNKSAHLIWWGDFVNKFAGSGSNEHNTEEVIDELITRIKEKQQEEAGKTRKAAAETGKTGEKATGPQKTLKLEQLGPPPEPNLDSF